MKKHLYLFIFFGTLFPSLVSAQQFKLHAEYRNDWYGAGIPMIADIQGYPSVTLQAESANDQFVIEADNSYNKWKKAGTDPLTAFNTPSAFDFFPNAGGVADNMFASNTVTGHFYTTRIKNQGYQSTQAVVMETAGAPAGILNVVLNPGNPVTNTPAPVAITTENRSPEEHFYIRYTTDNWLTSTTSEISFPGAGNNNGSGTIPALGNAGSVQFYIMSTTLLLQPGSTGVDYDLITLKQNNNAGANYTYNYSQPVFTTNVTFRVNMSQQTVAAQGVRLTGSFFNWSLDSALTLMTPLGNGVYEKTVALDTTATVQYKFINGNSFAQQENVPSACGQANGFGGFDRAFAVPNTNTTLSTVCFGSCTDCPVPVFSSVTFRVNMSQQTVSPQGVRLTGSFFNWSLDSALTALTSIGNGIYEKTVSIDTTAVVQYKFINGSNFAQQESVPSACGVNNGVGGFDRQLSVPNSNTTLATVCFGSCSNCQVAVFSSVTFRVNMSLQTVSPQGVRLTGSFFNWSLDSALTVMTSVGNGIYEKTVSIDTNAVVQYKFINGNSFAQQENVPSACGVNNSIGGFDRQLEVPGSTLTLPVICFGECNNCVLPVLVPITFQVDMSLTPPGPDGVRLAGSFNNWSLDNSTLMTPAGNGIYTKTIDLDTAASVQYKFVNGFAFSVAESVPQACGVSDGFGAFNRILSVPNSATTLPSVCFSSCSACTPVGAAEYAGKQSAEMYPNPAGAYFVVTRADRFQEVRIFDIRGKLKQVIKTEGKALLEVSSLDWTSGIYLIQLCGPSESEWHKLSKQ
jgi:hypothetical protein